MTPGSASSKTSALIGPDKGKGGKYLLFPPGYTGDVPDGYFVVNIPTYNNLMFLRGSIAKGLAPAVENIKIEAQDLSADQGRQSSRDQSLSTFPARATTRS